MTGSGSACFGMFRNKKSASLGMKSFGKSAPIKDLYDHFNLTSNNVIELAKKLLGK